jgi:L-threonylcarbamoyladenylate synthase
MKVVPATLKNIALAAEALINGKLVVMPTETVYGLAADATNEQAVKRIFTAKERPSDNPLIVHIADLSQVSLVAREFPIPARLLAERFWPGPLTLVLPKAESVSLAVTGGLDTVAVRMPAHPVALSLIRKAGIPIAAPSANRFMKLSPTRAEHVDSVLARRAEMVLDGGPSKVGVESTVVDCTGEVPRILRPGGVSRGDIEATLGAPLGGMPPDEIRRSPGMYQRHYAPKSPLKLVEQLTEKMAGLTFEAPLNPKQIKMPKSAGAYSSVLYDSLHKLDRMKITTIYVQEPPEGPEWEAVRDRLTKASQPKE